MRRLSLIAPQLRSYASRWSSCDAARVLACGGERGIGGCNATEDESHIVRRASHPFLLNEGLWCWQRESWAENKRVIVQKGRRVFQKGGRQESSETSLPSFGQQRPAKMAAKKILHLLEVNMARKGARTSYHCKLIQLILHVHILVCNVPVIKRAGSSRWCCS